MQLTRDAHACFSLLVNALTVDRDTVCFLPRLFYGRKAETVSCSAEPRAEARHRCLTRHQVGTSSLRSTRSTCVSTVRRLKGNCSASALLLSPKTMSSSIWVLTFRQRRSRNSISAGGASQRRADNRRSYRCRLLGAFFGSAQLKQASKRFPQTGLSLAPCRILRSRCRLLAWGVR